jgi:plasmid replication initiation protein
MTKKVAPTPKDVVAQDNRMNLARYDLSPVQKKLVAMVYSKVRLEDDDFHEYEFHRKDVARLLHRENDNDFEWLKPELKRLQKQLAELPNEEDPTGWISSVFFPTISYSPKTGMIGFQLAPKMKPYFLKLQREYTLVPLPYVMGLSGKYAIRLLELVMQWWAVIERTKKHTISVEVEDLRQAWGLGTKYREMRDFKKTVVDRAVLELNAARYGFQVEALMVRDGHRGSASRFDFTVIRLKKDDPVPVDPSTPEDETVEGLSAERRVWYEKILREVQAEGDLLPLAGYSSEFIRNNAQQVEALKRLRELHPLRKRAAKAKR